MSLHDTVAVLALLNAMFGESILVLPVLALEAGYLSIVLTTMYLGTLSGYCTYLLASHLGRSQSISEAILEHFSGRKKYQLIYSIAICVSFASLSNSLYQLDTKRAYGFFDPSPLIGVPSPSASSSKP